MTDKTQIVTYVNNAILDSIEYYRYKEKVSTRSQAILNLIKIGLKQCGYAVEEGAEPPEKK